MRFQVQVFTYIWLFFNGKCRYIRHGSCGFPQFFKAHARRNVCMAVEIPLLAKFGYEANEESVHQHSILVKKTSVITWQYTRTNVHGKGCQGLKWTGHL